MVAGGRTTAPIELKIGERSHPGLLSNRLNDPEDTFPYCQLLVPKRPKKVDHCEFRTYHSPGAHPATAGRSCVPGSRLLAPGDSRERPEAIPDASYPLWEEIQSLKIVDHFSVNSEVGFLIFHDKFVFGEVNWKNKIKVEKRSFPTVPVRASNSQ